MPRLLIFIPPPFGANLELPFRLSRVRLEAIVILVASICEARAATVNIILQDYPIPSSIQIYQGDTVSWLGRHSPGGTRVSGINSEFQSPSFIEPEQSFAYTFTNAGFVVYEQSFDSFPPPRYGTIDVRPLHESVPKVTMNSPVQDYYFSNFSDVPLLASVNISNAIKQVEFFADGSSVGVVTNFPYRLDWRNYSTGRFVVYARAMDAADRSFDSGPVTINVISNFLVTAPRMLESGHFVFHYVTRENFTLGRSSDVGGLPECLPKRSSNYGTFVEPATNHPHRFYWPVHCP